MAYPPVAGGVATASARLARLLCQHGYRVHVIVPLARPDAPEALVSTDEDGVVVHRFWQQAPATPAAAYAFRQAVARLDAREQFELMHGVFLTAAHPCVLTAGRRHPAVPVIASARGSDVSWLLEQPVARALILPVLRRATWITSVNADYLARMAEHVDVTGRSSVINGAAPPLRQPAWSLETAVAGAVGSVGEFRRVKDIPLLARAYLGLPRALRRQLVLGGYFSDVEEERWTQTLITEAGAETEYIVTGRLSLAAVETHLRALHVYVQSSAAEGMPNALLEAAALGVPIVATRVGGMAEVLEDGVSAMLVPHGDPFAMSVAIGRILTDRALSTRLSQGARAVAARLSPEREATAWLSLYDRLLRRS